MANEASHVGQYVLINENERFAAFRRGRKDKRREGKKVVERTQDKKLGDNFWSVKGPNGETVAMGFDSPAARCTDGAPSGSSTHLNTTSYKFAEQAKDGTWKPSSTNGANINANEIPYVVLPQYAENAVDESGAILLNDYGQNKPKPGTVTGFDAAKSTSPFKAVGLRRGDYVKVTNPANGKSAYAIIGELGPHAELGEYSVKLMDMLGMKPTGSIADGALKVTAFPGSGKRTPDGKLIQKQTSDEIQKSGKAAEDARSGYKGGNVVTKGVETVLIGPQRQPAAYADPTCVHTGGGHMIEGSDSVSYANRPAVRVGDLCSIGQASISGEATVLVFGNPTSAASAAPAAPASAGPFPLTTWADRVMKPLQESTSAMSDAAAGVPALWKTASSVL